MKRFTVALLAILVVAGALFSQATDKFAVDYERADRLLDKKNYEEAYEIYNKLIKQGMARGFGAEMKYRAAQCAYNLGRFEVSISLLEEILNEDIPADSRYSYLEPQAKFSLGLTYFQIGETQRAQRYLDEAEELGGMGIADYLIRRDYSTAYDHLKEKQYPVDKLFLARSLIQSEDPAYFSDIRFLLTELSDDVSLEELVEFSRAEMQFLNNDYATAKNVFRDFVAKYPHTALRSFAEYYLACTYFHEREYRYSIDLLGKLTDPNETGFILASHAFFRLGEAYRELNLPDSAMFAFEQARIVAPNSMVDFYTTYRLYQIHREEGRLDVGKREARRLGEIALQGKDQKLMTNLSAYVRGSIEFDETKYSQALNFYNEVTTDIPSPDYSTEEELLVYEAAMAMAVLALNRQNNMGSYNAAMTKPQVYLTTVKKDSVEVQYGGDWRAYLLYNQADAVYYSSYNPRGEVRNIKRHQDAYDRYQYVLENYPGAYVSTLAKVAMAWFKLENQRYAEAITDFEGIFDNTLKTDARVLAAYGNALANFYSGNYSTAGSWFLSEQDYEAMGVAVRREDATERMRYNEIADSLIARNLFWRGVCYERLSAYGDALDIYQKIMDDYRERPKAGESGRKTIEILLMAGEVDRGRAKVEEVKSLMTQYPRIYKEAYGFGLASLFDYYANVLGDEATAETYAKRLTSELGTSEPIEELYYRQAMRDTAVALIGDLRDKIQKIRVLNPRSQFLPEPMYNLSYLLFQNKEYEEAKEVLVELKNWPDANATRDMMPDISYQLSRVYFEMQSFADAVTELEAWTRYYETGDNARTDLAPYIYWWLGWSYFQQGEQEGLSPQVRAGFYRKALSNFENLQNAYGDSDFYQDVSADIDQLIAQCKRKIG